MKLFRNTVFSFSFVLLLVQTCAKDQDEQLAEGRTVEPVGTKKELVVADWKTFRTTADKIVGITENNLKTLRRMIDTTSSGDNKIKWNLIYQQSDYQLSELKSSFQDRDLAFTRELTRYDGSSGRANTEFKKLFFYQAGEINDALQDVINGE